MIVQACINGARPRDYHPRLPVTPEELARDGAACVASGAAELHLHPRGADGKESLAAVGEAVRALREACPGTLFGVSTGAWIENDIDRTRRAIAAWQDLPDYASVNLAEPDAPGLIELLQRLGVGVEAGLATVADAERLLGLPDPQRVFRILIEIEEQGTRRATQVAEDIFDTLERAGLRRPILLHGFDATVWHFARLARRRRWSTRVGLEDGKCLADGTVAPDNAALVAAACALFRSGGN